MKKWLLGPAAVEVKKIQEPMALAEDAECKEVSGPCNYRSLLLSLLLLMLLFLLLLSPETLSC